eukprot:162940-Amphidinium_carterae.1
MRFLGQNEAASFPAVTRVAALAQRCPGLDGALPQARNEQRRRLIRGRFPRGGIEHSARQLQLIAEPRNPAMALTVLGVC